MNNQSERNIPNDPEPCWGKISVNYCGLGISCQPIRAFEDLQFHPNLLKGFSECEFDYPYKTQKYILSILLDKQINHLGIHAPSGSGKSIAVLMSVLQKIMISDFSPLQFLIICPTCDSAENNFILMCEMAKYCPKIEVHLLIRSNKPKKNSKFNGQAIIGTPEKILHFIEKKSLSVENVQSLILDNVDDIIDHGRDKRIFQIAYAKRCPIIMLSSTAKTSRVTDFQEKLCSSNPVIVEFPMIYAIPKTVKSDFVECHSFNEQFSVFEWLLQTFQGQIILFCNARDDVNHIYNHLQKKSDCEKSFKVALLHGKLSREKQVKTRQDFSDGYIQVLVSTHSFNVFSPALQVVVNCDVILTCDKNDLDFNVYGNSKLIFKDSPGLVLNILDRAWAKSARADKLDVLLLDDLIAKY